METQLRESGTPVLRGPRLPRHEAYRHIRRNVARLLSGIAADTNPPVPACPQWRLDELLAHLVRVAATAGGHRRSSITEMFDAEHGPPDAGNGRADLLRVWERLGADVDAMLAGRGGRTGSILVMDAFSHELDIRYTLDAEPTADHPAFACAFEVAAAGFAATVTAHQLPALRLVATDSFGTRWTIGAGKPAATVTAGRLDLYRSLTGRRSHDQITALGWDRDSHRWLPAFTWGPFTPPPAPVEPLQTVDRLPAR